MADGHEITSAELDLENDQACDINLKNFLKYDEKQSLLKWTGTFELLKDFCVKILKIEDLVCSEQKRSRKIKSKSAVLTLYKNTSTLQIHGNHAKDLKCQLKSFIGESSEETSREEVSRQSSNEERREKVQRSPTSNDSTTKSTPSMEEISAIKSEISRIWEALKSPSTNELHQQSLAELKQENSLLNSTIASLKIQISSIEEERDSLRIALQLICKDLNQARSSAIVPEVYKFPSVNHHNNEIQITSKQNRNASSSKESQKQSKESQEIIHVPDSDNDHHNNEIPNTSKHRNASSSKVSQKRSKEVQANKTHKKSQRPTTKPAEIQTENRFEVLQDPGKEPQTETPNNTTVIIGDSMIKNVQGWKLGRKAGHRVIVKSFPGASTADMFHYLKPTLDKKPDQVILHIGTNDLNKSSPAQIADNIVRLSKMIKDEAQSKVTLSEIITRTDKTPVDDIKILNEHLNRSSNQNGWGIIRHGNISKEHLNKGGLHLNEKGVSTLAKNFINFLNQQ